MLRTNAIKAIRHLTRGTYHPLNRVELDRSSMLSNIALIQGQHHGFEIIPVLKGNAYGHGIVPIAEILNSSHCNLLAVDGYFEAVMIRKITNKGVLVMGHILPENVKMLDTKRCTFVVQDLSGLKAFGALHRPVRIHIELNTGMNRLGLQSGELEGYLKVLRSYPKLELEGVMTHLADADNESDQSFNVKQTSIFDTLVKRILDAGFNPKLIHIAQTAGSPKIQSRYANSIRLGIGSYGINPLSPLDSHYHDLDALRPVLELKSTIIKVIDLSKGDKVSYNCTFTAPKTMPVGVLPLGYYEGVPRELSNMGVVTAGANQLRILGRVCMDHTVIDLSETSLQIGDEVTVISKVASMPNSVARMHTSYQLFSYTTLTGISSSVHREIV
jgi:alanine racemase